MKNYNVHLVELRKAKGLSIKEAAKSMGINRWMLYFYENGYFRPSKKAIEKLKNFYGETISLSGEDSYPIPFQSEESEAKKVALKKKRIIFGAISAFLLTITMTGVALFNNAVHNNETFYGDIYNEARTNVLKEGKIGHDLVTGMEYRYFESGLGADHTRLVFYTKDNLLYFNESLWTVTVFNKDNDMVRFHYKFGSNQGVSSYNCEFNYGNLSKGTHYSCNFEYKGAEITSFSNFNLAVKGAQELTPEIILSEINYRIKDVNKAISAGYSTCLQRPVNFLYDFLPAREQGRTINFGLQLSGLIFIIPFTIAFFIIFAKFISYMIANIKPRLIITEIKNKKEEKPLPEDIKFKFGIPDIFVIIFAKVLQYGSIFMMVVALIAKIGLPLPSFLGENSFLTAMQTTLIAGIFLEHFVVLGRIKTSTALFRVIIYNLGLFLFIATMETIVIAITNAWGYNLESLVYNYVPGNVYQVVAVHYLIFLFLFFQPPFLSSRKKYIRIIWHALSLLPLGFLVASYFISNAYVLVYGVKENIFINFWFPNGFLILSIVCILYFYGSFFLRIYYERKYGQAKAQLFFYGDRFIYMENGIFAGLILIAAALDFIFMKNQFALYIGLGKNAWILTLIPLILFSKYSPNNRQVYLLMETLPTREIESK